ncbi:MAG: hypothetical protein K2R98_26830 [Gemmataceae bacterium]|nr:hypothetical protein [Gemmataceae bacterium]
MRTLAILFIASAVLIPPPTAIAADTGPLLTKIKAVGKEGAGNVEATKAWQDLVKLGPAVLIDTLTALDDADPVAANWLRSAVDSIADREINAGKPLPVDKLEAFIKDTRRSGAGRRLAYEWLARVDASTPKRLLPGMLNDPGSELRRDAVAVAIADAQGLLDKDDKAAARTAFKKLLGAARDRDQVDVIAGKLRMLGETVDLTAHFGFIPRWSIVMPFDNTGSKGFPVVYPPEKGVDLNAVYKGKDGDVRWKEVTTADPYGMVDINTLLTKHMGAVAYAFAAVDSDKEQTVQVRAGSNNAIKIFLNGKEIFNREEYHHGNRMDQHIGAGVLKPGRNEILVKVCQNEQKDAWAQSWSFQVRICDDIGGAVPFKVRDEKPKAPSEEKK